MVREATLWCSYFNHGCKGQINTWSSLHVLLVNCVTVLYLVLFTNPEWPSECTGISRWWSAILQDSGLFTKTCDRRVGRGRRYSWASEATITWQVPKSWVCLFEGIKGMLRPPNDYRFPSKVLEAMLGADALNQPVSILPLPNTPFSISSRHTWMFNTNPSHPLSRTFSQRNKLSHKKQWSSPA